jgi:uncharacterized protein with FMN-binding domain
MMKRIGYFLLSTVTILVLLFGYRTSLMGPMSSNETVVSGGAASAGGSRAFTGSVAQTEWGPVQVEISVTGSQIAEVQVLQYPNDNPKDVQINNYALPVLVHETLVAQSADIQMVSGATVTSQGYITSLQAALDEAGL